MITQTINFQNISVNIMKVALPLSLWKGTQTQIYIDGLSKSIFEISHFKPNEVRLYP